jgi:hypothetical protein
MLIHREREREREEKVPLSHVRFKFGLIRRLCGEQEMEFSLIFQEFGACNLDLHNYYNKQTAKHIISICIYLTTQDCITPRRPVSS